MERIVDFQNVYNKDPFPVTASISGTAAATSGNYGMFYTALFPCEVLAVSEVHAVAGTDAGAVTLQVEKLTSTTAPGSGTNLLASAIDLKGTANTVVYPSLTTTVLNRQLAKGDRLALKPSGTVTAVSGVQVTCILKPLGKGHYAVPITST